MPDIYDYLKDSIKIKLELYKDNNFFLLSSQIIKLNQDSILIEPVQSPDRSYNILEGEKFAILVQKEEGLYIGESKVLEKNLTQKPGILISYPTNCRLTQRREYSRVPANIKGSLTLLKNRELTRKIRKKQETKDIELLG